MSETLTPLETAEAALAKILTTGGVARLREGEKWVEYHPANVQELKSYIATLRGAAISAVRISSSKGFGR